MKVFSEMNKNNSVEQCFKFGKICKNIFSQILSKNLMVSVCNINFKQSYKFLTKLDQDKSKFQDQHQSKDYGDRFFVLERDRFTGRKR